MRSTPARRTPRSGAAARWSASRGIWIAVPRPGVFANCGGGSSQRHLWPRLLRHQPERLHLRQAVASAQQLGQLPHSLVWRRARKHCCQPERGRLQCQPSPRNGRRVQHGTPLCWCRLPRLRTSKQRPEGQGVRLWRRLRSRCLRLQRQLPRCGSAGADNKFEQFNLGVSFGFGSGRLLANLQQNRIEGGAKGIALATTYSHELSKRTNLYASYARLSNNASGSFGISSSGTSVAPGASSPGADPSVLAVGVRHRF